MRTVFRLIGRRVAEGDPRRADLVGQRVERGVTGDARSVLRGRAPRPIGAATTRPSTPPLAGEREDPFTLRCSLGAQAVVDVHDADLSMHRDQQIGERRRIGDRASRRRGSAGRRGRRPLREGHASRLHAPIVGQLPATTKPQ